MKCVYVPLYVHEAPIHRRHHEAPTERSFGTFLGALQCLQTEGASYTCIYTHRHILVIFIQIWGVPHKAPIEGLCEVTI